MTITPHVTLWTPTKGPTSGSTNGIADSKDCFLSWRIACKCRVCPILLPDPPPYPSCPRVHNAAFVPLHAVSHTNMSLRQHKTSPAGKIILTHQLVTSQRSKVKPETANRLRSFFCLFEGGGLQCLILDSTFWDCSPHFSAKAGTHFSWS